MTGTLYILWIWLFGGLIDNETLDNNKFVVASVAFPIPLIVQLGVLMSSIGAGLQSLTGAPQLLQTIVEDDVLPGLGWLRFTKGEESKKMKEKAKLQETARTTMTATRARAMSAGSAGDAGVSAGAGAGAGAAPSSAGADVEAGSTAEAITVEDVQASADEVAEQPKGAGWKAVWLTWAIASLPCLAGNLDHITPFVTIMFLMMYATVNFACFLLVYLGTPNFRPTFKYFHWSLSLLGMVVCIVLMFVAVIWWQAIIVIFIAALLYKLVQYHARHTTGTWGDWGDSLTALHMQQATSNLLALRGKPVHPKNWRPQLLVLARLNDDGVPEKPALISFAAQLKQRKGLSIVATAVPGNLTSPEDRFAADQQQRQLESFMQVFSLDGFAKVLVADNPDLSLPELVQNSGLGALEPNAVVMGWPAVWREDPDKTERFVGLLNGIKNVGKSLIVMKGVSVCGCLVVWLYVAVGMWVCRVCVCVFAPHDLCPRTC